MRLATLPLGLTLPLLAVLSLQGEPGTGHPRDPRVIDRQLPDLADYRPVRSAIATRVAAAANIQASQPGYLGIHVEPDEKGRLRIVAVEPKSPAAAGGLQEKDVLLQLGGHTVTDAEQVGSYLRSLAAGETLVVQIEREGKEEHRRCTLGATSRLNAVGGGNRVGLGIRFSEANSQVRVDTVQPDSPAAAAGVKAGDELIQVDDKRIRGTADITAAVTAKQAGQTVALILKRDGKELGLSTRLIPLPTTEAPRSYNAWDIRSNRLFKKPVYRLAVIRIAYPDVKMNPALSTNDWEQTLFSEGTYIGKSATGQQVYGSLNDYYREQSCGKLRVEGKVFEPVLVNRKREEYGQDRNRFALLTEALDKLQARDGADALAGFDGIFFLHAGNRVATNRGGLYWPHRSTMSHKGKRWDYFICPEGQRAMESISVTVHEFGHMLGLPDLYARPESPGSEGLGIWCTMANGHGQDGKPKHFSAWCKIQMGWLEPVVVDPTVKQKLVLAPIEYSPNECLKILIRPDGSEYLLLEVRSKSLSGRDLPEAGLLIWRVVDGRPVLEESHGVAGPDGPGRYLTQVPYPSGVNNAFTPYTTPSSRSLKGGGLPVFITNITRLPDGRVSFLIGYEFM